MLSINFSTIGGAYVGRHKLATLTQFSTKAPGGCFEATVVVPDDDVARGQEYQRGRVRILDVYDEGAEKLWSGRLADHEYNIDSGVSTLKFEGWWNTLSDSVFGTGSQGTTAATTPSAVLQQIATNNAPMLGYSIRAITDNTTSIVPSVGNGALYVPEQSALNVALSMASVPGTDGTMYYPMVWSDRRLTYQARPTSPTWWVDVKDLQPGTNLSQSWRDIYSSVKIEYTDGNGDRQTSRVYTDGANQGYLGYDRLFVMKLSTSQTLSEGTAGTSPIELLARMFLNEHAAPKQRTSSIRIMSGYVRNQWGRRVPIHRVRAGDMIRITRLPVIVEGYAGNADSLRSLVVVQSNWTLGQNGPDTLEIVPDFADDSVEALLARVMRGEMPSQDMFAAPTPY